ncbi:hypothetical protein ABZV31_38150 [Streptomyces sp. NPDC005202]|uniref:hypothetical protein n=1 Tax=Streptomyces sp. NPDC005202 TaxID=3157021 RepID=UPI0033B5FE03
MGEARRRDAGRVDPTGSAPTINCLLDASTSIAMLSVVLDFECTWCDPEADWTSRRAEAQSDERVAFGESHGPWAELPNALLRAWIYEARYLGAIRLERYRLENADGVREGY